MKVQALLSWTAVIQLVLCWYAIPFPHERLIISICHLPTSLAHPDPFAFLKSLRVLQLWIEDEALYVLHSQLLHCSGQLRSKEATAVARRRVSWAGISRWCRGREGSETPVDWMERRRKNLRGTLQGYKAQLCWGCGLLALLLPQPQPLPLPGRKVRGQGREPQWHQNATITGASHPPG